MHVPNSPDEYLSQFDDETKARLMKIRQIVLSIVPEAEEALSYGLIGYKLNGKPLIYFGGFKNHVGFYATPNGHKAFKEDLSQYKQGKGSVQFPLGQPLPIELIKRVVAYCKTQVGG